jgi:vitamin B12 transporter
VAHDTSDRTSGATAPDRFASERDHAVLQATWKPSARQQFTFALEHQRERAESSSYAADTRRDNDAFVLAWVGGAGPLALQAEWRRDDSSVYGSIDTGRLGLRWPLGSVASGLALRALVADSFRAPSFNDLVFPGYGVPTLRPERGRSAEAGIEWRSSGADLALTVYRQDQRDLIAYEPDAALCPPDPAYAFGCARNVQRARLQGATLAGGYGWTDTLGRWHLRGTFDALDARDRLTDARLPRRAASQQSVALRWRGSAIGAGAELLRVGGRPDGGIGLPAETTLDLVGDWRFAAGWSLQAKLVNATDRDLQPQRDYQGLGRQAWLALRWEGSL